MLGSSLVVFLLVLVCRLVHSSLLPPSSTLAHKLDDPLLLLTSASSPVVGILAQPSLNRNGTSTTATTQQQPQYIAASYVKWLEMGGARSIPIPYDASPALLDDLLTQIHGLLLPGGATNELPPSVLYLLDRIVTSNRQGNYFPVWGTCLGFEFLVAHMGGAAAVQSGFNAENISLALEHIQVRELYQDPVTFQTVMTQNVTMNNHERGIEPHHFRSNPELSAVWAITSINHDTSGRPFVSTIEPIDPNQFPLYGVQYHPEKNAFEFATYPGTNIPYEAINHSEHAVAFAAYTARFFVRRVRTAARDNPYHDYSRPDTYPLTGTYPTSTGLAFEQIYHIPPASHWNCSSNSSNNSSNNNNSMAAHGGWLRSTSVS